MPSGKRAQSTPAGGSEKKFKQSDPSAENSAATSDGAGPAASAVWCSTCCLPSTAACRDAHACVDLRAARVEVERRQRALNATLRELDALEVKLGVKLTAKATLVGEIDEEDEDGAIGITLAVDSLSADERAAVLELLEGLETGPDATCLSGGLYPSLLRKAAFLSLRARLPSHVPGTTLKAGAILICGDEDDEAEDDEYLSGEEVDEDETKMESQDIRIYFNRAVKPRQAQGARVLGYVTTNLKLLSGATRGWLDTDDYRQDGEGCYNWGKGLTLSDVKFV